MRLAYFSTAAKTFSKDELLLMLTLFRQKNAQFNISGLLIYCDDCFFQVIEGVEDDIAQLWINILKDKNHTLVTEILKCPIKEKSYAKWSMAFTHYKNSKEIYVEGFKDLLDVYQEHNISLKSEHKIAEIIRQLSQSQK